MPLLRCGQVKLIVAPPNRLCLCRSHWRQCYPCIGMHMNTQTALCMKLYPWTKAADGPTSFFSDSGGAFSDPPKQCDFSTAWRVTHRIRPRASTTALRALDFLLQARGWVVVTAATHCEVRSFVQRSHACLCRFALSSSFGPVCSLQPLHGLVIGLQTGNCLSRTWKSGLL